MSAMKDFEFISGVVTKFLMNDAKKRENLTKAIRDNIVFGTGIVETSLVNGYIEIKHVPYGTSKECSTCNEEESK